MQKSWEKTSDLLIFCCWIRECFMRMCVCVYCSCGCSMWIKMKTEKGGGSGNFCTCKTKMVAKQQAATREWYNLLKIYKNSTWTLAYNWDYNFGLRHTHMHITYSHVPRRIMMNAFHFSRADEKNRARCVKFACLFTKWLTRYYDDCGWHHMICYRLYRLYI